MHMLNFKRKHLVYCHCVKSLMTEKDNESKLSPYIWFQVLLDRYPNVHGKEYGKFRSLYYKINK